MVKIQSFLLKIFCSTDYLIGKEIDEEGDCISPRFFNHVLHVQTKKK